MRTHVYVRAELQFHSHLNDQNSFHSTNDEKPPGVPEVSKNPDHQIEVHSGELEPKLKKLWKNIKIEQKL